MIEAIVTNLDVSGHFFAEQERPIQLQLLEKQISYGGKFPAS